MSRRSTLPPVTPAGAQVTLDLRRKTLAYLADAPIGTLVYVDTPNAANLRAELERRLAARGLALRDRGAFHLEIVATRSVAPPQEHACGFCGGAVWCGRCRRCGTAVSDEES